MIGNLKESAVPYVLEHLRLAKMSFDLWGALSPTVDDKRALPGAEEDAVAAAHVEQEKKKATDEKKCGGQASAKRSMSQAELESSLYKVMIANLTH